MAGIDNSIYCFILKQFSEIDNDTEFRQSVLTEKLLAYNVTLRSNLINGRSSNHLVYWPDDAQSSLWRNGSGTSDESEARFKELDKRASEQRFPNKCENEYSFSSLAYDVLLQYMRIYASKRSGKELDVVKEKVCWCLDNQCLPESFSNDILDKESLEDIAAFIITSVEKAKAKGVNDRTTQTAKASLRKLKNVSYHELASKEKENISMTLAEIDPSVCINASSVDKISTSWANAVNKHSTHFNFLVKEHNSKLVGCGFFLPTNEQYKESILKGTLFEESLSSSFTPFLPRPGEYLFTILSLDILREETETITLRTKSNLKILIDSLWNTLVDYAKKGVFFKNLYAYAPVDTALWEQLGFVKCPEASMVLALDMTATPDGICPKELQQLYSEHFAPKGIRKIATLLKKSSKTKRKKGVSIIAYASLLFLLVLGIAKITRPPEPPIEITAEPEPPIEITAEPEPPVDVGVIPEETYNITLDASSTMSLLDFNSNVEAIKKRLDLLCNGEDYTFELNNLSIELCLPKSVFHDEDPESIMVAYIAHAINFYLVDIQNYGRYGGDALSIERKDIESVSYKTGKIDGLDITQFNIDAEPYPYIELILTPECTDRVSSEIAAWKEPVFAHDITNDNWYYFDTFLDLENRAIYLPCDEVDRKFAEFRVSLYDEDPLTDSFFIDIEREIEWERAAEAIYPGANQCDLKDLQGPTVQVVYTSYEKEKDTGAWVDAEVGFKKRLDTLEQPYAFGTFVTSDGYINVVIRTSPSRMGAPIMNLLECYNSDLMYVCETKHATFNVYDTEAEIITKDDGSREYRMKTVFPDRYETTNLRDLLPELDEGESCELKLCLDFVPLLSAYVDNSLEEKQVSFTHLYFNDHEALSFSNEWVLNLLDTVIHDSHFITFTPDSYEFYDEQGNINDEIGFGSHYTEDIDKLNETLNAVSTDMLFSYSSGDPGHLTIFIDLPVDETLPQTAVDMAEEIFLATDFENSFLNSITISLIDEDDLEKERARILFNKYDYEEKIHYSFIFMNGRLDKYSAEFESAIKSSSLFAGMETW